MARFNQSAPQTDMPPDVTEADLKHPTSDDYIPYGKQQEYGLEHCGTSLTFYRTPAFGWVLRTLEISRARKAGQTDRYYGITVNDGQSVRVGRGPHVTKEITIHFTTANIERLKPYVELWTRGMTMAGSIRDRISSRRAEGQERRANGEQSWTWNH